MLAERIEQRWVDALVSLRQYAGFKSEGWRRTAALVDLTRARLERFDEPESLAQEYLAVVLLRRIRIDDPTTQTSPFVRDAGFALRYVELQTGVRLSVTALPSWLGEWAVV